MITTTLNETWLNGTYDLAGIGRCAIKTSLPYVSIGKDYFFQGEEAESVIRDIWAIWRKNDLSVEDALARWTSYMLY